MRPDISEPKVTRLEARSKKSLVVAYALFFPLGLLGAHRFYLGRPVSAALLALCVVGSFFLRLTPVANNRVWVFLFGVIWWISDAFRMPTLAGRGPPKSPKTVAPSPPPVLARATGRTGTIEVTERGVTIIRSGLMGVLVQGFKGTKAIPFGSITAVQFKQPNLFVLGLIQFSILGGVERQGLFDSASDENTVTFGQSAQAAFERIKHIVEARISNRGSAPSNSFAEEVEKLAGLRDRGVLTAEEFEQRKAAMLRNGVGGTA
ncbi:NINE protein [Mesorhizobium sp. B2-3-3]|nr:NINE protein [Mesorhizobium sp. B2-3-3]